MLWPTWHAPTSWFLDGVLLLRLAIVFPHFRQLPGCQHQNLCLNGATSSCGASLANIFSAAQVGTLLHAPHIRVVRTTNSGSSCCRLVSAALSSFSIFWPVAAAFGSQELAQHNLYQHQGGCTALRAH